MTRNGCRCLLCFQLDRVRVLIVLAELLEDVEEKRCREERPRRILVREAATVLLVPFVKHIAGKLCNKRLSSILQSGEAIKKR